MKQIFSPRKSQGKRKGGRRYDDVFDGVETTDNEGFPLSSPKAPLIASSTTPAGSSRQHRSVVTNPNNIELLTQHVNSSRAQRAGAKEDSGSRLGYNFDSVLGLSPKRPSRSRSVDPGMQSISSRTRNSRSVSPSTLRKRPTRTARSASPSNRSSRSKTLSRTRRSISPSNRSSRSRPRTFEQRDDVDTTGLLMMEGATPYRLSKDMTFLADGINLDGNTRLLLAACDARNLDDFYLMADTDFQDFVRKARAPNYCLPPLQIRKVRILRRWLNDLVYETMDTSKYPKRLIPKNWAEKYESDLPRLKLQLRQQGDSIFERYPIFQMIGWCG